MGVGTLYRHFPTRSDLIVAVFKSDVERCVSDISSIRSRFAPAEALTVWIESYVDFITARRGLAAAMNSLDPALINLPAYFQEKLGPLLQGLLDDVSVENSSKSDLRASEVLHAVAMLCVPSSCGEVSDPMRLVRTFIAGIKQ